MTQSHFETVHLRFTLWIPEHGSREDDPNYAYFHRARERLKQAGKLICWRCGATEDIQLHHNAVEWCSINAVDIARFAKHFPELMPGNCDEAAFLKAVESEHGLLALCRRCHVGKAGDGIHYTPYPEWVKGAYWKMGLPAPTAPEVEGK